MRAVKVAGVATLFAAAPALAATSVGYELQIGGDNHADAVKGGTLTLYTAGNPADNQVVTRGPGETKVVNWAASITAGGTYGASVPTNGVANFVFDLEIRQGDANGPLATSAVFGSTINDGTVTCPSFPAAAAAFAFSFHYFDVGVGRVIDPIFDLNTCPNGDPLPQGAPNMKVFTYPTVEPGKLLGMGAGYQDWIKNGDLSTLTTAGVGLVGAPQNGDPAAGIVPVVEGQLTLPASLPDGTYTLKLIPGAGTNVLRGSPDKNLASDSPAFAVAADSTSGDTITFVLQTETVAVCPSLTAWRSVRSHGAGVGNQSIALGATRVGNGTSGPTVEPRNGGIRQIEIDLSSPVASVTGTVSAIDLSTNTPIPASSVNLINGGLTLQVNFNSGVLANATCYKIDLSNNLGCTIDGDPDSLIRALVGDANGDGSVSLIDFQLVKSRVGQAVAPTNIRNDVNADGAISLIDAQLVKTRVGNTVTCP